MSSEPLLQSEQREGEPDRPMLSTRRQLHRFLTSKAAHYTILSVVALDVACLFADIIINLLTCNHRTPPTEKALKALEIISLVFSCLFVLELLASIWAFGKEYFQSRFHIFDASVIIASFVVEVALQGVTEEVASLIVILRLMRVVKIVDELSVGAEEQMKELGDRLAEYEKENGRLKAEIEELRGRRGRELV